MAEEKQVQQAETTTTEEVSIIDQMLAKNKSIDTSEKRAISGYVSELVRQVQQGAKIISGDMERSIKSWQAEIDRKISQQLSEILHAEKFQKLEGTWRGLAHLISNSETGDNLKIKVLNATKKTLLKDLERASEFDQSTLFKHVYTAEYGQLGGKPYGLLVGDYDFDYSPDDVETLRKISGVAASSHAPFVAAAGAKMFGYDSYQELGETRDLAKIFAGEDHIAWNAFRSSPDSRYVALTCPRTLARLPYGAETKPVEEFNYEEGVDGQDHKKYLWMNAAWSYATRCTAAFAEDGWFMRTRGVEGGGKVENLPVHVFKSGGGKEVKCPTEVLISDRRENELSNLGFLPLCYSKDSDFAAFIGTQSCQKPDKYFDAVANANAEVSTKLNYMLCVSRFSHYLKVMARNWLGSMMSPTECESKLNDWIKNYVVAKPDLVGNDIKARCPLQEARVDVISNPEKPGWYQAKIYLKPHFQLEGLSAAMHMVSEIPKKSG